MFDLLPRGMRVVVNLLPGKLDGEVLEGRGQSGVGLAVTKLACDGISDLDRVHDHSIPIFRKRDR